MAVKRVTAATDGDLQIAGNWDPSKPVDGDVVHILDDLEHDLTNGDFRANGSVNPLSMHLGGKFKKSIGTGSVAMKFEGFTAYPNGEIRFDLVYGGATQIVNLDVTTCPSVVVTGTGSHEKACFFSGGTYTHFLAGGGPSIRIGTGVTVTKLTVRDYPGKIKPKVYIEEGATIGSLVAEGECTVLSYADLGTVTASGKAKVYQLGPATADATSIQAFGDAIVYLQGLGGVVGATELHDNALVDSLTDSPRAWTFSNVELFGGTFKAKAIDICTNDPIEKGGKNLKPGSSKILLPAPL